MRRRYLITAAISGCVALFAASEVLAQAGGKVPRLCFMTFDPGTPQTTRFGAFFGKLNELGYREGRTIEIDYLSADGQGERFPAMTEECLRRGADLIAVTTTPAARAATTAARTVPIVMLGFAVDPTQIGLVASLARPGGNLTGQSSFAPGLAAKRLQLLAELVPGLSRVLVPAYLADPITAPQIDELERTAGALNLTLDIRDIRSAADLAPAFADAVNDKAEALLAINASIFFVNRARIIELAARHRLPASYPFLIQAREGGLMAYSPNLEDMYRRAALQVDRVLKGAKPANLPIEQPTKFELVINLKTANALGLTVPPALLARADEVIE